VTVVPSAEPANEPGLGLPSPGVPVTRIVKSEGGGQEKPSGQMTFFVTRRVQVWAMVMVAVRWRSDGGQMAVRWRSDGDQ
jgi:hypothetical protein